MLEVRKIHTKESEKKEEESDKNEICSDQENSGRTAMSEVKILNSDCKEQAMFWPLFIII